LVDLIEKEMKIVHSPRKLPILLSSKSCSNGVFVSINRAEGIKTPRETK